MSFKDDELIGGEYLALKHEQFKAMQAQHDPNELRKRIAELEAEVVKSQIKVFEAIGWVYAFCCAALDDGRDPRQIEAPEILDKAGQQLVLNPQEQSDG